MVIACVYRTLVSYLTLFCDNIDRLFIQVTIKRSIFICGYFNIDLLKHDTHRGTKHIDEAYDSFMNNFSVLHNETASPS